MKRLLVAALVCLSLLVATRPAAAQVGEAITNYAVAIEVASDGTLQITETIDYDFGETERHGIIRDLVRRERYGNDEYREYDLHITGVTADGVPVGFDTSSDEFFTHIKIGDPDRTITGEHRYVIEYTVGDALLPFPDHDELFWDAIGDRWTVTIEQAEVVVVTPVAPTQIACFAGPEFSTLPCESATTDGTTSRFTASQLFPGSSLTVVVGIPKGAIEPEPTVNIYKRRTVADAFALTPVTGAAAGIVAILAIGTVLLVARRGRDRRYKGSPVDAAMGNVSGEDEPAPLGGLDAGPVEYVPPEGIRPGQVGTLVDERADLVDVTATIVDLAVRGHLKITEIAPERGAPDYELEKLASGKGGLLPYEEELYSALFDSRSSVKLSDLKYKFTGEISAVQSALYTDMVSQGWYNIRPDNTRLVWRLIGLAMLIGGAALTVLTAAFTSFGLVPLGLVIAGVLMMVVGGRMPARTAKGSAALSRIRGFRRLFDEGEEDTRARFAEQAGIFSQYLPYAIVFGCTEKWARAFEGLDAQALGTAGWYSGYDGFTALAFASAISHFETTATGTMYASPPSSSSSSGFSGGGFSGGGGGGGGGSSW